MDIDTEDILEAVYNCERDGCTPGDRIAHPLRSLVVASRRVEQGDVHGRDAEEDVDLVPIEEGECCVAVEFRDEDEGRTDPQPRVEDAGLAECVEKRKSAEDSVAGAQIEGRDQERVDLFHEREVAALRSLWRAGHAARVENRRGVAGIGRG